MLRRTDELKFLLEIVGELAANPHKIPKDGPGTLNAARRMAKVAEKDIATSELLRIDMDGSRQTTEVFRHLVKSVEHMLLAAGVDVPGVNGVDQDAKSSS